MSNSESVSYEVYKMVRGRWTMHARFGDGDRDAAFSEAAAQERIETVSACCIIKESYSAADNAAMESVVYHSASLDEPPSVRAVTREQIAEPAVDRDTMPVTSVAPEPHATTAMQTSSEPVTRMVQRPASSARKTEWSGNRASVGGEDDEDTDLDQAAPVPAPNPNTGGEGRTVEFSIFEAVLRFFAVLALSLLAGTLFGAAVYFVLKSTPALGVSLSTDQARTIILSAGLLGAVAAFFPLVRYMLPDMNLPGKDGRRGPAAAQSMVPVGLHHQQAALAGATAGAGGAGPMRREPLPPLPPLSAGGFDSPEAIADTAAALGLGAQPDPETPADTTSPASDGVVESDRKPAVGTRSAAAPEPAPAPVPRNKPESVAAVTQELQSLAEEAKAAIDESKGRLDPYRCFGLTLFLAGAGESLGRWHQVTHRRVAKAVAAIVEGLGTPADEAAGFAYHIDEYLLEPRFHEMYAAGRSSAVHRQYDDEGPSDVADAMNAWSRPAPMAQDAPVSGVEKDLATVMLTRIESRRADKASAMAPLPAECVRIHDEIVRDTLGRYGGREIKHTGDGVLASFPRAAAGVEAASTVQQLFQRLRETTPEVSAALSIVVATGAPIQKTSDPRRTPIRIAAGLMAKADEDEVLVAPPVPDLIPGQSFRLERSGTFNIAGINDPVAMFRLNW